MRVPRTSRMRKLCGPRGVAYQPPPVEQARSATFSRMVRTIEAMMLNMHPLVRTRIGIRGSLVGSVDSSGAGAPGSNRARGSALVR